MSDLTKLMEVTLAMTDKALSRWNRCGRCDSIMIGKECEECKMDKKYFIKARNLCKECGETISTNTCLEESLCNECYGEWWDATQSKHVEEGPVKSECDYE